MDTSSMRLGARPDDKELLTPIRRLTDPDPTHSRLQKRHATAKQLPPHQLNSALQDRRHPPQDIASRHQLVRIPDSGAVHGERELRLGGGTKVSKKGRGGHAGAGASGYLKAGVRGEASASTEPQILGYPLSSPLLALNGEASIGTGFEQYAEAGLPPVSLGSGIYVDEPLGIDQKSNGFVGVRAKGGGSAGPTHAEVRGEAFAGAKTGGQTQLTLGDQRFKVNGDIRAGIGLDAAASAGLRRMPNGRTRLKLEGRIGGALGVGGAIGGGVDLDVTPVANAIKAVPRHARNARNARNGAKSVRSSFERVGKALSNAGKDAVKVIKEVTTAPFRFLKSLFS